MAKRSRYRRTEETSLLAWILDRFFPGWSGEAERSEAAREPDALDDADEAPLDDGGTGVRPARMVVMSLALFVLMAALPIGRRSVRRVVERINGRAVVPLVPNDAWALAAHPTLPLDLREVELGLLRWERIEEAIRFDPNNAILRRRRAALAVDLATRHPSEWYDVDGQRPEAFEPVAAQALAELRAAEPDNAMTWYLQAQLHAVTDPERVDADIAAAERAPRVDTGAADLRDWQVLLSRVRLPAELGALADTDAPPHVMGCYHDALQPGGLRPAGGGPSTPAERLQAIAEMVALGRRLQQEAKGLDDWETGAECLKRADHQAWRNNLRAQRLRPVERAEHLAAALRKLGREDDADHLEAVGRAGFHPFERRNARGRVLEPAADPHEWRWEQYERRLVPAARALLWLPLLVPLLFVHTLLTLGAAALAAQRRDVPAVRWPWRDVLGVGLVALVSVLLAAGLAGLTVVYAARFAENGWGQTWVAWPATGAASVAMAVAVVAPVVVSRAALRARVRRRHRDAVARLRAERALEPGGLAIGGAALLLLATLTVGLTGALWWRLDSAMASQPAAEQRLVEAAQRALER